MGNSRQSHSWLPSTLCGMMKSHHSSRKGSLHAQASEAPRRGIGEEPWNHPLAETLENILKKENCIHCGKTMALTQDLGEPSSLQDCTE